MAGLSGYIITFIIALCATVIGGTIVQLIRPLYIDRIEDTKSAAQNLTAFFIFTFTSFALGLLLYLPFGVVLAIGLGLTFGVSTARYWLILDCYGLETASAEKQTTFATLKSQLADGGLGVKRYNHYLGWALDRVDRFFGDADPAVKTLWPGAFGFEGNKPFWTAPAYDRCLSIALIYPLAMLSIVWGISGEIGAVELALGLRDDVAWWLRLPFLILLAVMAGTAFATKNIASSRVQLAAVVTFFYAGLFGYNAAAAADSLGVGLVFFLVVGVFVFSGVTATASAIAFIIAASIGDVLFGDIVADVVDENVVAGLFAVFGVAFGLLAVIVAFVAAFASVYNRARAQKRQGQFLAGFSMLFLLSCYVVALGLGGGDNWEPVSSILLFFGVLTLVNAPFDWLSIGLTRALLRRGVEAGGIAPVLLALVDVVLATLLIVVLAAAMVFAVDLFEVAGRTKIIDVAGVLDALADPVQRLETKYWWIYATLFSTLIPSLLNVALAALSFMRGIIPFHRRVAGRMLTGGETVGTSWWMAPALGLEVVGAAMIGLYLSYLWIFKAVPLLFQPFEWLIPMLRWVAGLV